MREWTIYARARGRGFSTDSANYNRGSHRWKYKVYARSLKQAWCAVVHEHFAPGPKQAGIRRIEFAYWYTRSMRETGDLTLAPYLLNHNSEESQLNSESRSPAVPVTSPSDV